MHKLTQLWRRLQFLLRREQFDRELDEEMRFHLEMKAQENAEAGMDQQQAGYAAQRQFGNATLLQEVSRQVWGFALFETLIQDIRYGLRTLRKSPGFTFVAVLSLALGIGANTAIFSLVDKLLVRSLPVKSPEQLVMLSAESVNPKFLNTIFSYSDYLDYRDQNQVLAGLVAFAQIDGRLGAGEQSEKVRLEMASWNYFEVLGVRPVKGRAFIPDEDRTEDSHPVAVLSHGLWQRRFGSDPDIIGRPVTLNDVKLTVIGIAPQGFTGTRLERPTEVWVPLMMRRQLLQATTSLHERRLAWLRWRHEGKGLSWLLLTPAIYFMDEQLPNPSPRTKCVIDLVAELELRRL